VPDSVVPDPVVPDPASRPTLLPLGALALLVAAVGAGWIYGSRNPQWQLQAPPFFAEFGFSSPLRLLPALALAIAGYWWLIRPAASHLALRASVVALGWALALMWADGPTGLEGISGPYDYLAVLPSIGKTGVSNFLSTFSASVAEYPIHVQGHPPGFPVLLYGLSQLGLVGTGPLVALAAGGWAVATGCAVAVAGWLRREADRWVAPFVAVSPAALWVASADGFFAGVVALSILLVVFAALHGGWRSRLAAGGAGIVGGGALLLTYGAAPLVLLGGVVALRRRRYDTLAWAAGGGLAVLVASSLFGFSWLAGLEATRQRYEAGVSSERPFAYFVWANLAVLAVMLGPAVLRGLGRLTAKRDLLTALATAAVAAVLLADLSGLSRGEVERIWIPFVPWLALGAAGRWPHRAVWFASATLVTFSVQMVVRSPW